MENGARKNTKNAKNDGNGNGHSNSNTSDAAVMATNDDAFMCKLSATKCGYYSDAYLAAFSAATTKPDSDSDSVSNKNVTRPPIINRGTFVRVKLIERIVRTFVSQHKNKKRCQVVSFGAGYDTLPFRLFSQPDKDTEGVDYIELDFPEVVRSKMELIEAVCCRDDDDTDENINIGRDKHNHKHFGVGEALFKSVRKLSGDSLIAESVRGGNRYALHGCDLRELCGDTTMSIFNSNCGYFDAALPTLFLTECVLMYLPPASSDALIAYCGNRKYFSSSMNVFVNYEPIRPDDAFGRQMVANICARGSGLLGIREYPDEKAQCERFRKYGWKFTDAVNTRVAYDRLYTRDEKLLLNKVQILDEVEEWNLIMEHYVVVCARSDQSVQVDAIFTRDGGNSNSNGNGSGNGNSNRIR